MRPISLLSLLSFLSLVVSACGGGQQPAGDGVQGTVSVDGSSTVFPLTEAVAEEFMLENPGVSVTVGSSGTGGGIAKLLRGEIDIANASRPIKGDEAADAEAAGVGFIEIPVAYDGIALVVNTANDWAECLTVDELRAMWEPGSTVDNWREVRGGFPDRPMRLYGAGTDSGTYDYFTAAVVGEEGASRADFTASEDDNVLVQGVAGDVSALGFVPLSYYEANRERLRLVGVTAGDDASGADCIDPSPETVRDGTYQPLSRPIFIYVNEERAADPAVAAFVEYYIEHAGALAEEVGYVALSPEAYAAGAERFEARVVGSVFDGGSQVGVRLEDLLRMEGAAPDSAAVPDSAAAGAPAGDTVGVTP
jgi:phosphate transport system substrate-binding protein